MTRKTAEEESDLSTPEGQRGVVGGGVRPRQGGEGVAALPPAAPSRRCACDAPVCRDAQRPGTCCSVMIQPLSAALTQQDAVATVAAASLAAAAAPAAAAPGPAVALTSPA